MKKFEYIDRVINNGQEMNLYLSLENGQCYTFTDEEVEMINTAEANIERRRQLREYRKIERARKAKRNKRIGIIALVGLMLFTLHTSKPKDDVVISPIVVYEQPNIENNYRNLLVTLLNAANGEYEDEAYRKLFYLYYNVYFSGIESSSLINSLIDYDNPKSIFTKDDFDYWYETGNVDFRKLMLFPEQTADMIDYENIDIFLNFNICLKKEVESGNLTFDEYLAYINPFLVALDKKDPDIKRVWDYYSENNSVTKSFIDVKLLCYEDTIKR